MKKRQTFVFATTTVWKESNVPDGDKKNCEMGVKTADTEWFIHFGFYVKTNTLKSDVIEKFGELLSLIYPNEYHETMELKALTWKQPFAQLMLHGKIETRSWLTHYRGWVLICAGAQSYNDRIIREMAGDDNYQRILDIFNDKPIVWEKGKAIAIGKLVDCRPMTPEDAVACFVNYNPKLWCHIYENVQPIRPFDWKGAQGWRRVGPAANIQIIQP